METLALVDKYKTLKKRLNSWYHIKNKWRTHFLTLISYKQQWVRKQMLKHCGCLFFFFAYKIYTLCSEGSWGSNSPPGRKKHCTIAAFICLILLKIGLGYDLSYPTQASCMYRHFTFQNHHNSLIIFFILNVPFKKMFLTCTFSPS